MGLEISGLTTSQTTTNKTKGSPQAAGQNSDNKAKATTPNSGNPTVSISDAGKSLSQLQGEVAKGGSLDESKIAELKAAIADGSYQPNAERIAGKLLDIDSQF